MTAIPESGAAETFPSPDELQARLPMYAAGFTGIGVIVLAALVYSIQVSVDPAAGNLPLTTVFLALNVLGWTVGAWLRARDRDSLAGFLLVLLGDALFPLNLYAPLVLSTPGFRGDIELSVTAVLLIGLCYHLWNYQNRRRARFALFFYPYFFAAGGAALLYLLPKTSSLPLWLAAWFLLAFAVTFNELSWRQQPEPGVHFAFASGLLLLGSLAFSALGVATERSEIMLAAMLTAAVATIVTAIRRRADTGVARFFGFAAWISVTVCATALLYYFHSPLWLYIVATSSWTLVLAIVSMRTREGWSEPFYESAWWTVMLLAAGLLAALVRLSLPWIVRTVAPFSSMQALQAPAALALIELAVALVLVSSWRRRNPPIASSFVGFVTSQILLRIASFAAPLILLTGATGLWLILHAPSPGNVYVPLVVGALLLFVAPSLERFYPAEALDFGGITALLLAAFNGLSSPALSAIVLLAGAGILLRRWWRGAAGWTYPAFLVLATVAGILATTSLPPQSRGLPPAGLSALLLILLAKLPEGRRSLPLVAGTKVWATALAIVCLAQQPPGLPFSMLVFLLLAVAMERSSAWLERATFPETWKDLIELSYRAGYWTAHIAAFFFWISLLLALGLVRGYAAIAGVSWAWVVFAGWKLFRSRMDRPIGAQTAAQFCVALAFISLLTALIGAPNTRVMSISILTAAVLILEIPGNKQDPWTALRFAGFILLAAPIAIAFSQGDGPALTATLGFVGGVLLWQSLKEGSMRCHLSFIVTTAAAAILLLPERGLLRMLPIAVLVAALLLVEKSLHRLEDKISFRADLTLVVALLCTLTVLGMEVASGRFSVPVLAVLFLSVMAIPPDVPASSRLSADFAQQHVHTAFIVTAQLAGVGLAIALTRAAGFSTGGQLLVLSLVGWAVLGALVRLRWRRPIRARATAITLHLICLTVYVAAFVLRNGDPAVILSCLSVAFIYFVWRLVQGQPIHEHLGWAGLIEAAAIWGLDRNIQWPEYYLSALTLYLCILLMRQDKGAGRSRRIPNALAIAAIALAIGYPLYALVSTGERGHSVFLAFSSVIVIHALLTSNRNPLLVYAVCVLLGAGMIYVVAVLHGDAIWKLLMVSVGFLVITDLGLIRWTAGQRSTIERTGSV